MPKMEYLIFENIPSSLKEREKILAVNIDVSGIQKFIFGSKTILDLEKDFSNKSRFVAALTQKICGKLQREFKDFVLFSDIGGRILCGFKRTRNEKRVIMCLDSIQRDIFILTKGKLQIFYGVCPCRVTKNPESPSVLPTLTTLALKNKYSCKNILFAELQSPPDMSLLPEEGEHSSASPPQNAAALKLDLDNLGVYFSSIPQVDKSREASVILNNIICAAAGNAIYAGGDDIFIALPFKDALTGAAEVYNRLKSNIALQLPLYHPHFGVSAGMCEVGNSVCAVPAVFYLQKSEEFLEKAKKQKGKNSICVEGECFSWEEFLFLAHLQKKYEDVLKARMGEEFMRKYPLRPSLLKQDLLKIHREARRKGEAILTSEEEKALER